MEKGIKAGHKPIEVMGLLLGRPNTDESGCLVVTDAFPLPIEGFETRVIADDQDVVNYMISLGEVRGLLLFACVCFACAVRCGRSPGCDVLCATF